MAKITDKDDKGKQKVQAVVSRAAQINGNPKPVSLSSDSTSFAKSGKWGTGNTFTRNKKGDLVRKTTGTANLNENETRDLKKIAATGGNGQFSGGEGPRIGGVKPINLIGVGGPHTGKRIVYVKKK